MIALIGVFGPRFAPHDPYSVRTGQIFTGPGTTWDHPLGTDHLGRDVLSRLLYLFRPHLISGLLAPVMGTVAAGFLEAMRIESDSQSAVRRLPPGGVLENSVGRLSVGIIFAGPVPLVPVMAVLGSSVLNLFVPTSILVSILTMSLIYQVVRRTMEDLAHSGQ